MFSIVISKLKSAKPQSLSKKKQYGSKKVAYAKETRTLHGDFCAQRSQFCIFGFEKKITL
jgi:hypothetical protein